MLQATATITASNSNSSSKSNNKSLGHSKHQQQQQQPCMYSKVGQRVHKVGTARLVCVVSKVVSA